MAVVYLQSRSWYVETASPVNKNLVIIIDRSGSMSGTRMRLAIEAALTVLDTLSPQDNVSSHGIYHGCYRTDLTNFYSSLLLVTHLFSISSHHCIKVYGKSKEQIVLDIINFERVLKKC